MKILKVGTLFSGIGAPEFALKNLKIPHVVEFACDIDSYAKATYSHNHECKKFYDDIKKMPAKLPKLDLLVFGFPCQPFSLAGKRQGLSDERGRLVLDAIEIIKRTKPKIFISENVEGLVQQDNGRTLKHLLNKFKKLGYTVRYRVLNALDYGIPQQRKRIWIVGIKDKNKYAFEPITLKRLSLKSVLDFKVDRRYYATQPFLSKPKVKKKLKLYNEDYIPCITQTISRNGSSSEYISYVAAVNHAIGQKRKPTPEECGRLFGFPKGFSFPENICVTQRYIMMANTMPVPVLENLLMDLKRYI